MTIQKMSTIYLLLLQLIKAKNQVRPVFALNSFWYKAFLSFWNLSEHIKKFEIFSNIIKTPLNLREDWFFETDYNLVYEAFLKMKNKKKMIIKFQKFYLN